MVEENLIKIPVGDKVIVLKYMDWDTDISVDEITRIDYSNLYGEIVTVTALYNRVGILKADVENDFENYKLDCKIFESQVRQRIVKEHLSLGNKKPSEGTLEDEVNTSPEIIAKRKQLNILQRNVSYVTALYWAIQSKDKKLSVLMKGVTPEEFASGIVEGIVNTFYIKKFDSKL
jgi:hypothetical protein